MTAASVEPVIRAVCAEVADLLAGKNAAYGNSALDPVRIFSRADPVEQLKVRIDDKLSRLARGDAAGEDVEWDLLGYLILLRVARRMGGNPLHRAGNPQRCWASMSEVERRGFMEGGDATIQFAVPPRDCPDCARPHVGTVVEDGCRCGAGEGG